MDGQTLAAVIGVGVVFTPIGIAIGRQMTVRRDLVALGKKYHDLVEWKNATLPKEYVQQRELALTLKPITDALGRLEAQQGTIADDVKAVTRWIDQHSDDAR